MQSIRHEDQPWETWRPGVETRMHVSACNGAMQLCIFEQVMALAAGAPTHSHPVEEVLTVLAGEADMWIDEKHVVLTKGQSLVVPPRRKHGFRNIGAKTLHVHAVLASPIFEGAFEGSVELMRRWLPPPAKLD